MCEEVFRTEDVLAVIKEVASHNNPHIEEHCNAHDSIVCDYCNKSITVYGTGHDTLFMLAKFKHDRNCTYLIAKDMLTGYE